VSALIVASQPIYIPALDPTNGKEVSLYFNYGVQAGYLNPIDNTIRTTASRGAVPVMRKSYYNALRDRTTVDNTAGMQDAYLLPMAYAGRAGAYGDKLPMSGYSPINSDITSRIIHKADANADWNIFEYLVTRKGRTGGKITASDSPSVGYPGEAVDYERLRVDASPGTPYAPVLMRSGYPAYYPASKTVRYPAADGFNPIGPYGNFGGTFLGTVATSSACWYDSVLHHLPGTEYSITVDEIPTPSDAWMTDYDVTWFIRIVRLGGDQSTYSRYDIRDFAMDIPALTWTRPSGAAASPPPVFDRTQYRIVWERGVPTIYRKTTDESAAGRPAPTHHWLFDAQTPTPEDEDDPIYDPPIVVPRAAYRYDLGNDYPPMPRVGKIKHAFAGGWQFIGGEDSRFRTLVNGIYTTGLYEKPDGAAWDWTGVDDDDIYEANSILVYAYYWDDVEEDWLFAYEIQIVMTAVSLEESPRSVSPVGYPVVNAKTGGISTMETQYHGGTYYDWLEITGAPTVSVPTCSMTCARSGSDLSVSITINTDSILDPGLGTTEYEYDLITDIASPFSVKIYACFGGDVDPSPHRVRWLYRGRGMIDTNVNRCEPTHDVTLSVGTQTVTLPATHYNFPATGSINVKARLTFRHMYMARKYGRTFIYGFVDLTATST
jgi:hypothetical protein